MNDDNASVDSTSLNIVRARFIQNYRRGQLAILNECIDALESMLATVGDDDEEEEEEEEEEAGGEVEGNEGNDDDEGDDDGDEEEE